MRGAALAYSLSLIAFAALAGCAGQTPFEQNQMAVVQQQQAVIAARSAELQNRAVALDQNNQELEALLAQTRQQKQLAEDQLAALREQLSNVSTQLASVRTDKSTIEQKAQAMAASTKRRLGASITANSSLRQNLPAVNIPGIEVRQDGDVIRIELPSDRLFETGGSRLLSGGGLLIESVAAELLRTYPDQLIGVEGHTDPDPLPTMQYGNHHQLSLARAQTVFDYLASRNRFRTNQLSVSGHGANHPVVSNATAAGKARNRRVELVVYPERFGQ